LTPHIEMHVSKLFSFQFIIHFTPVTYITRCCWSLSHTSQDAAGPCHIRHKMLLVPVTYVTRCCWSCASNFHFTVIQLLVDLWPWKPLQQWPL